LCHKYVLPSHMLSYPVGTCCSDCDILVCQILKIAKFTEFNSLVPVTFSIHWLSACVKTCFCTCLLCIPVHFQKMRTRMVRHSFVAV
jgi:hypothetical protein